ncbi:hypothetical protein ACLOJK_016854 [Asimina triloba]
MDVADNVAVDDERKELGLRFLRSISLTVRSTQSIPLAVGEGMFNRMWRGRTTYPASIDHTDPLEVSFELGDVIVDVGCSDPTYVIPDDNATVAGDAGRGSATRFHGLKMRGLQGSNSRPANERKDRGVPVERSEDDIRIVGRHVREKTAWELMPSS